ncbi:hypothetical protein POREN0001_0584 [Porphyromonas endodontalis ATCC 35406]|uniref:Uncharacterized protein n=1 Tax=Porphyromonas endodontalis (strain ATCC 35406 / DSM 24491 / JCM 8526 / CCUG 16442 / BCRC 14492 / NCTC 13058 / HG 370) TaxID=553175 RepID=C3J8R4_POREA|nr:hypothetical protein POREN0001_0584 [Porphyromonas endodontalis ATCC 35406]
MLSLLRDMQRSLAHSKGSNGERALSPVVYFPKLYEYKRAI